MQRAFWLAALAVAATVVGRSAPARGDDDDQAVPSIWVQGQGEVMVVPDVANVSVGVVTEGKTASEAVKANSQRMAELMKTLRDMDIADKHIQTSNFNVSPKQQYDRNGNQPPKIVGYAVSNMVTVKVLEVARLGAILDAVVTAGSNQVQGVSFSLAEPGPHLDQARRKAIADARHRAEVFAEEAGVKLGKPLIISELTESIPRPYPMAARAMMAAGESVPIAQGEQSVSAQVSVRYRMVEE